MHVPDSIFQDLTCQCERGTCGRSCEMCCPLHNQYPWTPGSYSNGGGCERKCAKLLKPLQCRACRPERIFKIRSLEFQLGASLELHIDCSPQTPRTKSTFAHCLFALQKQIVQKIFCILWLQLCETEPTVPIIARFENRARTDLARILSFCLQNVIVSTMRTSVCTTRLWRTTLSASIFMEK